MPEAKAGRPKPPPRERLLRSLVALLMTPFLLLTVLLIGCWLQASGKLSVHRRMVSPRCGRHGSTRRRRKSRAGDQVEARGSTHETPSDNRLETSG